MKIKVFPICKCGTILKDLCSFDKFVEVDEAHSKWITKFNYERCPKCGELIDGIELTSKSYFGRIEFNDYESEVNNENY